MQLNKLKSDRKHLDALFRSRGWSILRERMEAETNVAMRELTSRPSMPLDEVHFMRGAIFTAMALASMPEKYLQNLDNEIAFSEATKAADAMTTPEKIR